jgi:hypothetical protein
MGEDSLLRGRAMRLTDRRGERGVLDQLITAVRAGGSRVLVVRTGSWSVWRSWGSCRRWPPSARWCAWSMTSSGSIGRPELVVEGYQWNQWRKASAAASRRAE